MANPKDGQGHKNKYVDTNIKIMSQEMLMCNIKALIFIILKKIMSIFWKMSNFKVKRLSNIKKILQQGIFMCNINMKTHALTVEKKFVRLKFTNHRTNSKARSKIWWHFTESITRKYGAEFGGRGGRMSEKIKMVIAQLFASAFVGRSNQFQGEAFLQLFDQETRPVLLYQTVAIWERTRKNKKQQHTFVFIF